MNVYCNIKQTWEKKLETQVSMQIKIFAKILGASSKTWFQNFNKIVASLNFLSKIKLDPNNKILNKFYDLLRYFKWNNLIELRV